ncbi:MAG: purine-binding chemotaxis protein CheW [Nitrospirae bacterium]|nr:purine-binding chemotaxis protein CheW [Nitrospirota bacterium]
MVFRILDKLFGVRLNDTVEIIPPAKIREVPLTYFYVKGMMDYRGDFLPILSLRRRFSLDDPIDGDKFIVVIKSVEHFGVAVDDVIGIATVGDDKIESPPPKVMGISSKYMGGIIKHDERQVIILDMDALFTTQSRIQLII